MNIGELIEKYEQMKKEIVNPDEFESWEDLGFDEKPDKWETINQFLEADTGFDEGEQISLRLIGEFLDDLKQLTQS